MKKINVLKLKFLKQIYPPNYYAGSESRLSSKQNVNLNKIVSDMINESQIYLDYDSIDAISNCIDEFIRIAEDEIYTVSGYTQSELLEIKQFLINCIND